MLVTLFGIVVFLHPTINALSSFFIIALQLSLESNTAFLGSTIIVLKSLQAPNAFFPMLVTFFGIVMLFNLSQ